MVLYNEQNQFHHVFKLNSCNMNNDQLGKWAIIIIILVSLIKIINITF